MLSLQFTSNSQLHPSLLKLLLHMRLRLKIRTEDNCNIKTASSVNAQDGDTISKNFEEKFPFANFGTSVAILRLYTSNI